MIMAAIAYNLKKMMKFNKKRPLAMMARLPSGLNPPHDLLLQIGFFKLSPISLVVK